ncbi:MAG: nucleotidyl transferase AbiEii/AbiGii toxin family protein [Thermoplasmata archaeon]|nr:MAG: nucleotidyl transferase AbiEii/AbiGii toxin family protein [Thermoplasmata archaeon]
MIDLDTFKRIAKTKGITNLGYAEKDYFQEIVMLGVSREAPELVFKGGTALYKMHGLDRFSEDLDFSGRIEKQEVNRIAAYLEDFGYETEVVIKNMKTGSLLTFIANGFLYQGTPESRARVQMDVSKGGTSLDPKWLSFFSLYPDVPSFRLRVMDLEEIMGEKLRALVVRKKARDAYDIWFLLNKGVKIEPSLIREKLELYGIELDRTVLRVTLEECKGIWKRELKTLIWEMPEFAVVRDKIMEALAGSLD